MLNSYTYENNKWNFHRDGEVFESDNVAIIFEQDEPFDVLLKHGPAEKLEALVLGGRYNQLARAGSRLITLNVPPRCCEILNKCLSISASKWCSKLLAEMMRTI